MTVDLRPGTYVEITSATQTATGVRGRITHIDDADPIDRYRIHCDGGLIAWATRVRRAADTAPTPVPEHSTARSRRRRTPTT